MRPASFYGLVSTLLLCVLITLMGFPVWSKTGWHWNNFFILVVAVVLKEVYTVEQGYLTMDSIKAAFKIFIDLFFPPPPPKEEEKKEETK